MHTIDSALRTIFFYFEGGLGDVMLQFFSNKHISALPGYRKLHWWTYAKVILNVHNPQAAELFRYHPEFDEIQVLPFSSHRRDEYQNLSKSDRYIHYGGIDPIPDKPRFKLGGYDLEYLKMVLPVPEQPFILYHPGCGKAAMKIHFNKLFFDLAAERGLKVVQVGGTSENAAGIVVENREVLDHPAIVNLVSIANPRLVCEIARKASGFVGTLSCYQIATMLQNNCGNCCIKPRSINDSYVVRAKEHGAYVSDTEDIRHTAEYYNLLLDNCLRMRKPITAV